MAKLKTLLLAGVALAILTFAAASHVSGAGTGSLSVMPATQNVLSGAPDFMAVPGTGNPADFTVTIHQNVDVATVGVQADISFDPSLLKITDVTMGSGYAPGDPDFKTLVAGVAPQNLTQAIAAANSSGTLENAAVAYSDSTHGSVASGDAEALVLTMETLPMVSGTSPITLSNIEIIDSNGDPSTVAGGIASSNGQVVIAVNPDADGDGCASVHEQQVSGGTEVSGGRRDHLNPYDYFNPTGDHQNRVDDILKVVQQYFKDDNDGNPGLPPYAPNYNPNTDRTPLIGQDPWDLNLGNGQQRVDDILGIVKQYFHDCLAV